MENSRPATGYPYPPPGANGQPPQNTAYSYAAPPPQSQPYGYTPYYDAPPPNTWRNNFFRAFFITLIAIIVIFGSALLIFWLIVRPRVPEFHITSLSVSNLSVNQSQVTANWNAVIEAYNPNKKMSVSYYDAVSAIFYDNHLLGRTEMPPFGQGTREKTPLSAKFSAIDSYVERKDADKMNADRASGTVKFDIRLEAIAGFNFGAWKTRRRLIRVWCGDVPVGVSTKGSGSLVGGTRPCRVRM